MTKDAFCQAASMLVVTFLVWFNFTRRQAAHDLLISQNAANGLALGTQAWYAILAATTILIPHTSHCL